MPPLTPPPGWLVGVGDRVTQFVLAHLRAPTNVQAAGLGLELLARFGSALLDLVGFLAQGGAGLRREVFEGLLALRGRLRVLDVAACSRALLLGCHRRLAGDRRDELADLLVSESASEVALADDADQVMPIDDRQATDLVLAHRP